MIEILVFGLASMWMQTILFSVYFLYPTVIDRVLYRAPGWVSVPLVVLLGTSLGGSLWLLTLLTESAVRMWL